MDRIMNKPFKHSYAKQRLFETGSKIFVAGKQILLPRTKKELTIWDIKPLNTHIKSNTELMEQGEIKTITDYNDLIRMGFMIISEKAAERYFFHQSVAYKIKPFNNYVDNKLKSIPPQHYVEFDELNERVRLCGKNAGPTGVGQWVFLRQTRVSKQEYKYDLYQETEQLKRQILSKYMYIEETPEIIPIPEIPVMISAQGEVVCLENAKDEPVIGIVGGRGSGKTLMAHSILDHAYWKKPNLRLAILNDSLFQTQPWTLPCDYNPNPDSRRRMDNIFLKGIRKIGEHPLPMPLVFLHPSTDTLRETVFPEEDISFKTSIPFENVIQNYTYFLRGKKEWLLGKSAPYFRNIKDDLLKCSNIDEIEEVLNLAVEEEKLNKQSKEKILSVIIDMFNQRILDVNTKLPAYWEVHKPKRKPLKMNPVLAVMEAGAVPVVMTQNLLPKDYFPQYMRYFIDSIFEYQIQVAKYRNEATWMFIDELPDISSTENRTVAAYSLRRCVTEGRNPKLGTIFALQNWTKVDPQIRNNTTHLFSYHNKSNEARTIAKDFDLPTHIEKDIITLPKFRMIAMTHEKFVIYTPDGERYTTSEPIKGQAIMPLSQHQAPGSTEKKSGEDLDKEDEPDYSEYYAEDEDYEEGEEDEE